VVSTIAIIWLIVPSFHFSRREQHCSNGLGVCELPASVHGELWSAWPGLRHSIGLLQALNEACLLSSYRDAQDTSVAAVVQTWSSRRWEVSTFGDPNCIYTSFTVNIVNTTSCKNVDRESSFHPATMAIGTPGRPSSQEDSRPSTPGVGRRLPFLGSPGSTWQAYRSRIVNVMSSRAFRTWIAFFLFGLMNNILYVIVLSVRIAYAAKY
jgi:hypothetical protein